MLPQDLDRLLTDEEEQELVRLLPHIARQARAAGLDDNTGELLKRLQIGRAVWEKQPCYIGWIDMRLRVNGDVVPCDTCQLGHGEHSPPRHPGNLEQPGLPRLSPHQPPSFRHRGERAPVCL